MHLDITRAVERYSAGVGALRLGMPALFSPGHRAYYDEQFQLYREQGLPLPLAHEMTTIRALFSAMDIIDVAHELAFSVTKVGEVYFGIGEFLDLTWLRLQVISQPTENHWEALSREALRDDLDWQQRQLTAGIMRYYEHKQGRKMTHVADCFHHWSNDHDALIGRWQQVLVNLRSSTVLNDTMYFVAIRELLDLTQATIQVAGQEEDNSEEE